MLSLLIPTGSLDPWPSLCLSLDPQAWSQRRPSWLRDIAGIGYVFLALCQEEDSFSPFSVPGSQADEKCYKEQTVGREQSEVIRKRSQCLTQRMYFLVPHFLYHPVLLRSNTVTQFLPVLCLCCLWCGRTGSPQKQEMVNFWPVSPDWGGPGGWHRTWWLWWKCASPSHSLRLQH
jgi:hypothetical protein